jgi:glyoxylase I family protein
MEILGLVFVGTFSPARAAMATFARDVLGLTVADARGMDADVFDLPDGTALAVTGSDDGPAGRTVGLLVRDLDTAVAELRAAGVPTDDDVSGNEQERYIHFWAPDGQLYELIERRA